MKNAADSRDRKTLVSIRGTALGTPQLHSVRSTPLEVAAECAAEKLAFFLQLCSIAAVLVIRECKERSIKGVQYRCWSLWQEEMGDDGKKLSHTAFRSKLKNS